MDMQATAPARSELTGAYPAPVSELADQGLKIRGAIAAGDLIAADRKLVGALPPTVCRRTLRSPRGV